MSSATPKYILDLSAVKNMIGQAHAAKDAFHDMMAATQSNQLTGAANTSIRRQGSSITKL
jgi:hypothetical protein